MEKSNSKIKALRDFEILAEIKVDTAITIKADSMEDALAQAKELEVDDFIEFREVHNDSVMGIRGVFDNDINVEF